MAGCVCDQPFANETVAFIDAGVGFVSKVGNDNIQMLAAIPAPTRLAELHCPAGMGILLAQFGFVLAPLFENTALFEIVALCAQGTRGVA